MLIHDLYLRYGKIVKYRGFCHLYKIIMVLIKYLVYLPGMISLLIFIII